MNNNNSNLFASILAASTAGVAVFAFANTEFTAALRPDLLIATLAAVGVVRLAIFDYARRPLTLTAPAPVLRPSLPVAGTQDCARTACLAA